MKKIKKLLTLALCLIIIPCSLIFVGCEKNKNEEEVENTETSSSDLEVKTYLSADVAWSILQEAEAKLDSGALSEYDNFKVIATHPNQGPSSTEKAERYFLKNNNNSYLVRTVEKWYGSAEVSDEIWFKINDKAYNYNLSTKTCLELGSEEATFLTVNSETMRINEITKDQIVSGKVLNNGDYVVSCLFRYDTETLLGEITFSSNLLVKSFVCYWKSSSGEQLKNETIMVYGVVSSAMMSALVDEAKTHISE